MANNFRTAFGTSLLAALAYAVVLAAAEKYCRVLE
jgi:hypothetical protein